MEFTWETLTSLVKESVLIKSDIAALGLGEEQVLEDLTFMQNVVGDDPMDSHIFVLPDNGGNRREQDIVVDFEDGIRARLAQIHLLAVFFREIQALKGGRDFLSQYPSNSGMLEQLYATMYLKSFATIGEGSVDFAVEQIFPNTAGRKDADVVIRGKEPIYFHIFKVSEHEKSWKSWELYRDVQWQLRQMKSGLSMTNTVGSLPNPRGEDEVHLARLSMDAPYERIVLNTSCLMVKNEGSYIPELVRVIAGIDELASGIPCTIVLTLEQRRRGGDLGSRYKYQIQFEKPTEEVLPNGKRFYTSSGKGAGLDELFRLPSELSVRSKKLPEYESLNVFVCMLRGVGTVREEIELRANDISKWITDNSRANAVIFVNAAFQPNNKGLLLTRSAQVFGLRGQEELIRELMASLPETHFIPINT